MIKHLPRPPLITHVYGLEPNIHMHAQLQKAIDAEGLTDIYTILPSGASDLDALRGAGLEAGSVDTVLTVRVLCTLGEEHLEGAVAGLFECLKPGGQWLVFEHVRNERCVVSRVLQGMYGRLCWRRRVRKTNWSGCLDRGLSDLMAEDFCWVQSQQGDERDALQGWEVGCQ